MRLSKSIKIDHFKRGDAFLKETNIPWLFTDFNKHVRFSLTFYKIPWLFPDLEKIIVCPWLFPDRGNLVTFATLVCWFPIVCTSWVLSWVGNHKATAWFHRTWNWFLCKPHLEKGVGPHFIKIGRIRVVYVLNCALFQVLPSSQVRKTLKKGILY